MISGKTIIKGVARCGKVRCDGCGEIRRIRCISCFKGKYLCTKCRQRTSSNREMMSAQQIGKPLISLENALNKIYTLRNPPSKSPNTSIRLFLPMVLLNRKLKLILIEQDEELNKRLDKIFIPKLQSKGNQTAIFVHHSLLGKKIRLELVE